MRRFPSIRWIKLKDIIVKLKDAEKEIDLLRKKCADWARSYAEKCNDYEDLKRINAELTNSLIAERFSKIDD